MAFALDMTPPSVRSRGFRAARPGLGSMLPIIPQWMVQDPTIRAAIESIPKSPAPTPVQPIIPASTGPGITSAPTQMQPPMTAHDIGASTLAVPLSPSSSSAPTAPTSASTVVSPSLANAFDTGAAATAPAPSFSTLAVDDGGTASGTASGLPSWVLYAGIAAVAVVLFNSRKRKS